jgi:CRP-like cAMP-binding protein
VIKRPPSFNPKSFLAKIGEGRSIHAYHREQIVFSQGDPADAVFYIQKGKAKVTVASERGKEAVVAIFGPNDFFGKGCLAGQGLRIATVATLTESVIVRLEKAAIVRVIHQEPASPRCSLPIFLARQFASKPISSISCSIRARNVLRGCSCCWRTLARKPEPIIAKISQETLAEMIGTTHTRVNFFMNKFRKLGFIDYNGPIEVHSSLLNAVLHEEPKIEP